MTRKMGTTDIETELLEVQSDLFRFALKLTREENRAMDLLQETNIKALIGSGGYRPGTCFKSWVFTIMYHSFINQCRREQAMETVENPCYILPTGSTVEDCLLCDYSGFATDIERAVNSLPLIYREVFREFLAGRKYSEIAEALQLALGTVKSRINISRIYLRLFLDGYRSSL